MTAATLHFRSSHPPVDTRATIGWLTGIVVLVSLLTSDILWARLFNIAGAQDAPISEVASLTPRAEREIAQLIQLTETPGPTGSITPVEAIIRNDAIPFTHVPIASASPFQPQNLNDGTAGTALRCMTQAVYFEAGFEPLAGRRAVAQVVLNRVKHPAFPNSVCGVVYQGVNRRVCQFSFTCDGSLNRRPNPAAWAEAEAVARDALGGYVETAVGYATHYHANYVSPYWAPKLVKIARIGAHIFYRWPGGWGMPGAFSGHYAGNEVIPNILPRNILAKRSDVFDGQIRTVMDTGFVPVSPTDRHSETDVGGRLDLSKGWQLAIMEPEEIGRASTMVARQQAGEYEASVKGGGS